MVEIKELLAALKAEKVDVWLEGDQVRLQGRLSKHAALIDDLRRRRGEVIAFLRGADDYILAPRDPVFAQTAMGDFVSRLEPGRFLSVQSPFDSMISGAEDHYWDPRNPKYLDFSQPFDVMSKPLIAARHFRSLRAPSVQACLSTPEQVAQFINKVVWMRFSNLLHGEQGALSLSASLCGVLNDTAAQELVANQTREEARHVTAFSRYIEARWGRPAPCLPSLRDFLTEIVTSEDVTKKIVGMQIMVEGLAMGTLASLYRVLEDPVGRRLVQLVMTDETFHHRLGRLWAERVLRDLSEEERARLQAWTGHCLRTFVLRMNPPLELLVLRQDHRLDVLQIGRELAELPAKPEHDVLAPPIIFRVLANTLANAELLDVPSKLQFDAFIGGGRAEADDAEIDAIIAGGVDYLQGVNCGRRVSL